MVNAGSSVTFNFQGSLELAHDMWTLADNVETAHNERAQAATTAMRQWRGRYADTFANDTNQEQRTAANIAEELRTDAKKLALSWTDAMQEEGNIRYAAHTAQVKARRNLLEQLEVSLLGDHTNYGPRPTRPAVPYPPMFAPTAQLPTYS